MPEPTDNNELAAFQAALTRMTPAPDGINLAQLMFRAGQLSAPRRNWAWPCLTAASSMLAAALGAVLLFRPVPQPIERIITVYVQPSKSPASQIEPASPSPGETLIPSFQTEAGDGNYLQFRREVLANGLDALPPPSPWPAPVAAEDAGALLDLPPGSREPWLLRLNHSLHSGGPL